VTVVYSADKGIGTNMEPNAFAANQTQAQKTAAQQPTTGADGAKKKDDDIGKDAFLQLLVTQLKHQDPLDPQDNSEFLAQLAQFSSLESLQQIKEDMAALRGYIEAGTSGVADDAPATNGGA
jgi:flagellar basal-body rod modification protein FlgD